MTILALASAFWAFRPETPARLRARAQAATDAHDWPTARSLWHKLNQTPLARSTTELAEARACLALSQAANAERALRRALAADPSNSEAWRYLLEILRVEDRTVEANSLGWEAYSAVLPQARRGVLRDLTLALLADLPDDLAQRTLEKWIAADPSDLDARVALYRRLAAQSRSNGLDHNPDLIDIADRLNHHPEHLAARATLIVALADAGDPDRGRTLLDAWPERARTDPRYGQLRGRWDLDYDKAPERALIAFQAVLEQTPSDWKTHAALARTLRALGRPDDAKRAAETVSQLREALDPAKLGPRLSAALQHLDSPQSHHDLADLCTHAHLDRLANAWRTEAAGPARPSGNAHWPLP